MNVTASAQQHVEVPQIEQEFFLMIGWAIFILKGLYTKMMVIRGKNYYGRIKQFCAPQATCLNGSGSTVNKAS